MLSTPKKFLLILLTFVTLLAIAGCTAASKAGTAATISRQVPVTRGDLVVSVSVDGNLEMTDYYNLRFAASGEVKKVLVEEGDRVKQGQLLAYLDDTSARLDVKAANNSVQSSLSTLYETVPRLPQFPGAYYDRFGWNPITGKNEYLSPEGIHNNPVFQMYYPNATIMSSYGWAQEEVDRANELYQSDNYSAAASELYVAASDLEACIVILEDAINNPESGLGNVAPFVDGSNYYLFSITNDNSFAAYYIQELRREVAAIRQVQADISNVYSLLDQGKHDEARPLLAACLDTVEGISREVIENVNRLKLRNDTTIYGRDMSMYFYTAGIEKLNAAISGIGEGGLYSPQMNDNLRIAVHYMELCNGILGTNDYVLQHGLSLKAEQNAKIDLAGKLVNLDSTQNNYLNTFIWAPIEGTVVSVGVKKKDILSSKPNSSTNAIVLVNTGYLEFWGTVDEIDIMKIKVGQKATISVDAVPDQKFTGEVIFISPKGTADSNNVVKYNIRIKLDPTDVALKGKLTATADIAVSTVENALLVPLSAVTTTGSATTVTVVIGTNGETEKRAVTPGIQNQQFVQILTGLEEGERVVIVDKASGAPVSTTMGPPGGGPPPGGGGPPP